MGTNHRLVFAVGNMNTNGEFTPLPPPYSDFAKAMIIIIGSRGSLEYARLRVYMQVLRILGSILIQRGSQDPRDIRLHDLMETLATRQRRGVGPRTFVDVARILRRVADEMDHYGITNPPLCYRPSFKTPHTHTKHPLQKPAIYSERNDSQKLPSMQAIAAYAFCTNNPIDDDERILLRVCDLHIGLGTRINECLTMPEDCWLEEEIHDSDGRPLRHPESGEILKRYGVRFYPGKGYKFAINWLPDQDVPLVKRAIDELKVLCAPAREVARWQETHPGEVWAYKSTEALPVSTIRDYLHSESVSLLTGKLRRRGISPLQKADRWASRPTSYLAGDIAKAFPQMPKDLAPVRGPRGKVVLRLSQCLCVKFEGQFTVECGWQINLHPQIIKHSDIYGALGTANRKKESVFARRNLTEEGPDGKRYPIKIATHSTRHWKNTLYDLGGMSNLQQAWAMHRQHPNQTSVYQHRTVAESTAAHRNFLDLTLNERITFLRQGIREGTIQGSLTVTYNELRDIKPVKAEDFLRTHAVGIQITPWGICGNDFTLAPCPKYLQCHDNCKHYHRTMDPKEEARLRDLRTNMVRALGVVRGNASGEAGGVKWVQLLEQKLINIDRALAIPLVQIERTKSVPVFPDGTDKSKAPIPRRTVVD